MSADELLTWHPVATGLPDADITVLVWLEPGGEWFAGWWDGEQWLDAASGGRMEGVTHWAEPAGPVCALPADVARCAGYETDGGGLAADCADCLRRTDRSAFPQSAWMAPCIQVPHAPCPMRIAPRHRI